MAKRKAARATKRKTAGARAGAGRGRTAARQATRKAARKTARKTARKSVRTGAARKTANRRAGAATRKRAARTPARRSAKAPARKSAARKAAARPTRPGTAAHAKAVTARKTPALDRARKTVQEEDLVPTPPSSLDLDRSASAVRSGRRELRQKFDAHTETSPALTGGDVDADWEGAYSVGDEAPGGDNPTPDQDIVDDIGRAMGVQYEDNEELKGEKKISDRDRKRWELDPASSEDYDDR